MTATNISEFERAKPTETLKAINQLIKDVEEDALIQRGLIMDEDDRTMLANTNVLLGRLRGIKKLFLEGK